MVVDPILRHGSGTYALRFPGDAPTRGGSVSPPPSNPSYARTAFWVSAATATALLTVYIVIHIWFGR